MRISRLAILTVCCAIFGLFNTVKLLVAGPLIRLPSSVPIIGLEIHDSQSGLVISSVLRNGPAYKAGVRIRGPAVLINDESDFSACRDTLRKLEGNQNVGFDLGVSATFGLQSDLDSVRLPSFYSEAYPILRTRPFSTKCLSLLSAHAYRAAVGYMKVVAVGLQTVSCVNDLRRLILGGEHTVGDIVQLHLLTERSEPLSLDLRLEDLADYATDRSVSAFKNGHLV